VTLRGGRIAALAIILALPACATTTPTARDLTPTVEASLAGATQWSAVVPARWNGTLLLHSRGYSAAAGAPEAAPARYRDALLAAGYALAGSNYGSGGWALAEAVPAQEQTVAAFARRYGKPKRVIGYGFSMGGLVTTALAERPHPVVDGALSLCGSIGGSLAMMNMGLDGAFVFRTLVAPNSKIELVGVTDDRANAARVAAAAGEAAKTPAGRARIALAGTLAGIPGWVPSQPGEARDQAFERQFAALARGFPTGVFLPRAEQQQRAGGNFSWNDGVDYGALLAASGRERFVRHFYEKAGLDLSADMALLARTPRVVAAKPAVAYMAAHYVPTGEPRVPLLAVQALGDTVTSPSLQEGYAGMASGRMMQSLYLPQAGHCAFTSEQVLDALGRVGRRLDLGTWAAPSSLYARERPAPLLRPCFRHRRCDRPDER
jgi:pimeloyl-ACP methyl ester carboxylesterase